jgi:uncharacterized SAM-binding protein YcdF (DUF218 family)
MKMFLFKKIVGLFFIPLSLCLEIFIIGLILIWFTKKKITGKILISIGIALLILMSYDGLPNLILRPLEYQYSPLLKELPEVKWIVVLGGGATSDPKIPITSQLEFPSLFRLIEGIRLHHSLSGSKMILSGGTVFGPAADGKVMADVTIALGVDSQNLILETVSRDTEQEAKYVQRFVGIEPFILVTSASHMPRSVALFRKLGMQPIPAPTNYLAVEKKEALIDPSQFFPSSVNLTKMEIAIHEYLGLAWAKLRGRI